LGEHLTRREDWRRYQLLGHFASLARLEKVLMASRSDGVVLPDRVVCLQPRSLKGSVGNEIPDLLAEVSVVPAGQDFSIETVGLHDHCEFVNEIRGRQACRATVQER
jgi:hypothetical protein